MVTIANMYILPLTVTIFWVFILNFIDHTLWEMINCSNIFIRVEYPS